MTGPWHRPSPITPSMAQWIWYLYYPHCDVCPKLHPKIHAPQKLTPKPAKCQLFSLPCHLGGLSWAQRRKYKQWDTALCLWNGEEGGIRWSIPSAQHSRLRWGWTHLCEMIIMVGGYCPFVPHLNQERHMWMWLSLLATDQNTRHWWRQKEKIVKDKRTAISRCSQNLTQDRKGFSKVASDNSLQPKTGLRMSLHAALRRKETL